MTAGVLTMQLAVGHSDDPLTSAAVAEVIEQCREALGGSPPVAACFFAACDADHKFALEAVARAFPGLPLVGCTSDGELSSRLGFEEDSIVLGLFHGKGFSARAGIGERLSKDPRLATAQAVASASGSGAVARLCIALPESLTADGGSVVDGLNRVLDRSTLLVGGTSADPWLFERTHQFFGTQVYQDSVPVLMFYGDFSVSAGQRCGWTPVAQSGLVTRAVHNVIYEIDDRPALEFYHRYFGVQVEPASEFPLAVFGADASFCLRAPMSYAADGSVTYAGNIAAGARVQIAIASRHELVNACRESVAAAAEDFGQRPVQGAFIVSCSARKQLLGTRTSSEYASLRETLGDVPVIGFYGYGEIAPQGRRERSQFHNQTFVTVLLGDL